MGLDVVATTCHSCAMVFPVRTFTFVAVFMLTGSAWAQSIPIPTKNPNAAEPEVADQRNSTQREDKAEMRIYQAACPAVLNGSVTANFLPPVSKDQCGERSPLEVETVAGVKLTGKAILNCRMATALAEWVSDINKAAEVMLNAKIVTMISGTAYQCRRRNNTIDGKISEHGFANALDVTGFVLGNGKTISLSEDWPEVTAEQDIEEEAVGDVETGNEGRFLKTARDNACKHFTTVLGPDSNPLHADHFHLDLGCHGKRCTYKICE